MTHPCTLVLAEALHPNGSSASFWACDLDPADITDNTGFTVELEGLNVSSVNDNNYGQPIESGHTRFYADGISLDLPGKARIPKHATLQFDHHHDRDRRRRRLAVTLGRKEILVIRVQAPDSEPTATEAYVSDKVFGTSGDKVNLKTQYAACSMNQLLMNPANKTTTSNVLIENGVVSVLE